MRTLVIAVMIALLPLRGWVGDAMAAQVALAAQGADNVALSATGGSDAAEAPTANAQHDCAMHHTEASDSSVAVDDSPAPDHGVCNACQLCHSVGLHSGSVALALLSLPRPMLPVVSSAFASAEAALLARPPIA